jgi:hypothetical protein
MVFNRRQFLRAIAALAVGASATATARAQTPSRSKGLIFLDAAGLEKIKAQIDAGDADLGKAVVTLAKDAQAALAVKPLSVTDKAQLPPSGDKRDYLSQAPYFWPDPAAPDGKPYVRRDGEVNPESEAIPDAVAIDTMEATVGTLALAYHLTGEKRLAEHAAALLRAWFLDKNRGMRPNLDFAQLIPGVDTERPNGVIEGHVLCRVPDWATLLLDAGSPWRRENHAALKRWFGNYQRWLTLSANGKSTAKFRNNQGTWYWVQLASAALFAGDTSAARQAVKSGVDLISTQVRQDGAQVLELERTRPLAYSLFNLRGMMALATLGERVGIPEFCVNSALYVRSAFDYISARIDENASQFADGKTFRARELAELAFAASEIYGHAPYRRQAFKLDAKLHGARVTLTAARAGPACR